MSKTLLVSVGLALIAICSLSFINFPHKEVKEVAANTATTPTTSTSTPTSTHTASTSSIKEANVLTILVTNQNKPVVVYEELPKSATKIVETKPKTQTKKNRVVPKNVKVTVVNGHRFYRTKSIDALRNADYGTSDKKPIRIWTHNGGKRLNTKHLISTIDAVLQRMPNVKSSKKFTALILETFLIETDLGSANFEKAANKQRNYGIAQFTMETAKDTLQYLKKTRKDVYNAVMSMYDRKLSLRDNLMRNTPFSIALCAQLYLRCIPDIHPNIHTVGQRATAWKVYYNSVYGDGTIENYIAKVNHFRNENII